MTLLYQKKLVWHIFRHCPEMWGASTSWSSGGWWLPDMNILFILPLGDSEKHSSFFKWSQGMESWLSHTVTTLGVSPWTGSTCLTMNHAGGPSRPVLGISSPNKRLTASSGSGLRKGDPGQTTILNIEASVYWDVTAFLTKYAQSWAPLSKSLPREDENQDIKRIDSKTCYLVSVGLEGIRENSGAKLASTSHPTPNNHKSSLPSLLL